MAPGFWTGACDRRIKEIFDLSALPDEDRGYYQTLGGLS
jgi:hypothetical protein